MIDVLKRDHDLIRGLLAKFGATSIQAPQQRLYLVGQIERELTIHARVEEEVFYPAVLTSGGPAAPARIRHATKAHERMEQLRAALRKLAPNAPEFETKIRELAQEFEAHVQEEEQQLFVLARNNMSHSQFDRLLEDLDNRKKELRDQIAA